MKRQVGTEFQRKGLRTIKIPIYEEDTELSKEIQEIESNFMTSKGDTSSSFIQIGSREITNILLWRIFNKLE